MSSSLPLERMTCILKAKRQISESIWRPFINYVKDLDLTDEVNGFSFKCLLYLASITSTLIHLV